MERRSHGQGYAVSALVLSLVSFVNLLGAEKSILAIVLAAFALRGATSRGGLQQARIAIAVASLHILTLVLVLVLLRDKLAQLLQLPRQPVSGGVDALSYERQLRPLLGQAAAYARAHLRNKHDAEDVQQASLRAWERIDTMRRGRLKAGGSLCCATAALIFSAGGRPLQRRIWRTWTRLTIAQSKLATGVRSKAAELQGFPLRIEKFCASSTSANYRMTILQKQLSIPHGTVMSRLHLARKALAALIPKEDV